MALLGVLVLGFVGKSRTDLKIARNEAETARAEAIADAGVMLAILGAFDPSPDTRWRADGTVHVLTYDGGTIRASVQDEGGKIDLNTAPPELLSGLFRTAGLDSDSADALAGAVVAWRETTATTRPEADATSRDDVAVPPRRAFLSVDDLRLVPGVTPVLYAKVAPFVTVYSGLAQIDPLTAPAEVLRSVPGVDAARIAEFISARGQVRAAADDVSSTTLAGGLVAHRQLRVFSIVSDARLGGARFVRQAVGMLTGLRETPCRFLLWRRAR